MVGEFLEDNLELPINIEPLRVSRKEKKFMEMFRNIVTMEEHDEDLTNFKLRRSTSLTNKILKRPGYIIRENKLWLSKAHSSPQL